MKNYLVKILIPLLVTAIFAACTKEDGSTKTEYLTALSWRLEAAGLDANRDGTVDLPDTTLRNCDTDGTLSFFSKGTGLMDEGPSRCSPDMAQSRSFKWKFLNHEMQIEIDGKVYSLYSVGADRLKIYYEFDAGGDDYRRYLLVWKH